MSTARGRWEIKRVTSEEGKEVVAQEEVWVRGVGGENCLVLLIPVLV